VEGDAVHPWQRYHLSFHFSRTSKDHDKGGGRLNRHHDRRTELRAQARKLQKHLRRVTHSDTATINARSVAQELSSRVRSFDVAGNENHTPIEVFAPALRWLRERPLLQHDRGERLAERRGLSIHAGEDFDHLVSGLRHVDETVTFCAMGPGDRLGHALALGFDPMTWAERQGTAMVPLERHFDNLIWLWHHATMLSGRLADAAAVLPTLMRRIDFYGRLLEVNEYPPEVHYRAWKLRRNCAATLKSWETEPDLAQARYWVPDIAKDRDLTGRPEYKLHQDYLYHRHPRVTGIGEIAVHLNREGPPDREQDYFGLQDLRFVEALQDHLMTEYDRLGITIEACPSSNVHISRIADCMEHLCLRWHPPLPALLVNGAALNRFGLRRGPVRVCINTDDPGIFPTNIATEHLLMRHAAQERFDLSQSDAEA
jgi:hypothetical protein